MNTENKFIRYTGAYIHGGTLRRIKFEAVSREEADALAIKWGVGIEGEATEIDAPEPLPEAYDAKTACRLLGGISRQTLYREIRVGNLERLSDTRRVLVTRESMERRKRL